MSHPFVLTDVNELQPLNKPFIVVTLAVFHALKSNDVKDEHPWNIYDISGRRCMDYTVMTEDKMISIDLSMFKSGMYYYSITDDYGNVVIDRFVKK